MHHYMTWQKITDAVFEQKTRFIITFFFVFLGMYTFLYIIDFLPEEPTEEVVTEAAVEVTEAEREQMSDETDRPQSMPAEPVTIDDIQEQTNAAVPSGSETNKPDLPIAITIAKLDRTIDVLNPASRTIADLDAALLEGVVRHPDSAAPNQDGNVFILGHSSYLPSVFNRNFQAFNGIQNLEWGDEITLATEGMIYTYRVEKVYRARASEVTVPIANTGQMLTLATCNSFGSTDDRYIVEATLQSTEAA